MKTRIISALAGFLILLFVVLTGGMVFKVSILALSILGLFEYHKAVEKIKDRYIIGYMNYLFALSLFFLELFKLHDYFKEFLFLYSILLFIHLVFKEEMSLKDISYTLMGGIYIAFFLSHMYFFVDSLLIWIIFIVSWMTDTSAYFTGMFFGKRKLAPKLSPKKTVEGAIGGVVGAVIGCAVFAYIAGISNIGLIALVALIGSVLSQLGDLTASRIKRIVQIKDYGNIMPGHGGVLDRFDSIIFTTPFVYYALKLIGLI